MLYEIIANLRRWRREKYAAMGVPQNAQDLGPEERKDLDEIQPDWESNPWEDPGEEKEWQDLEGPDLPYEEGW